MKRRTVLTLAAALIVTAAALTGCMISGGTGSLAIDFGAAARTLGPGETYRVDVYYGRDRFTSVTAAGESVTLTDLPTGLATIYVAKGTGSGAAFVASRVATAQVSLVPGENTPGALALADVDFSTDTSAGGISSVVGLGGEVYAYTTAGVLKRGVFGTLGAGPTLPPGMTDVSLSRSRYFDGGAGSFVRQVWVNGSWSVGSGGILPWTGAAPGSLDASFADGFDVAANWDDASQPSFTVRESGAFFRNGATDNEDLLSIFYRKAGGIGGVGVQRDEQGGVGTWSWVMDQIDLVASLGDALPAGTEPILDFAVGPDALYVVLAFTTLKVSDEVLDDPAGLDAENFFDSPYVGFAEGVADPVVAAGVGPDAVYLGTQNGLWAGATSADPNVFFAEAPTLIPSTAGYTVRTIVVSDDGEHVAFVTERTGSPDSLVVLTVDSGDLATYATLQGLPGEDLSGLSWLDNDTLLVAGSGGLASLDVAP